MGIRSHIPCQAVLAASFFAVAGSPRVPGRLPGNFSFAGSKEKSPKEKSLGSEQRVKRNLGRVRERSSLAIPRQEHREKPGMQRAGLASLRRVDRNAPYMALS